MAVRKGITLAANAGAGNGASQQCEGGDYKLVAEATWGGGNIKLQQKTANSTWVDIASSTLSANGDLNVRLSPGEVRVVITTASAVYANLYPLG